MIRYLLYSLILTFFFSPIFSQQNIQIGKWETYLPHKRNISSASFENNVYFTSGNDVVINDLQENTFTFIDKANLLNNSSAIKLCVNKKHKELIVFYLDKSFDIFNIETENVNYFKQIKEDGNFKDRSVNTIRSFGDLTYFTTNFGVIIFDHTTHSFLSTLNFNLQVHDISLYENKLFIATEIGAYSIDKDSKSIAKLDSWTKFSNDFGLPTTYDCNFILKHDELFYAVINDEILSFDETHIIDTIKYDNFIPSFFNQDVDELIFGFECLGSCNGKIIQLKNNLITEFPNNCSNRPVGITKDSNGHFWISDNWNGIHVLENIANGCSDKFLPSIPTSNGTNILCENNKIYLATSRPSLEYGAQFISSGFHIYDYKNWQSFNQYTPQLKELDVIYDFIKILPHPDKNIVFIATYLDGLLVYENEIFKNYNASNSTLQNAIGDNLRCRIPDFALDSENNLWICNNKAPNPLSVFTNQSEWKAFSTIGDTDLRHIVIDDNNLIWTSIFKGRILVYDYNGTIEDESDDRQVLLGTQHGLDISQKILSLKKDLDGSIWVGTEDGVISFDCGLDVFEFCAGSRTIISDNGVDTELEYLLQGENVTSIAVDGNNNKWFGTNNGIFVIDANDGKTQLHYFNEDNSPLLNNTIISMDYEESTGKMFIVTNNGIIAYQTKSNPANITYFEDLIIFPNPIRPGYEGPISIQGLTEENNIKITDSNGNLIFETKVRGGQAIWNGKDYNGVKVKSGVYFIFGAETNGSKVGAIGKVLIVR